MNPPLPNYDVFQSMTRGTWEVRRLLDEHKRGLITVGAISVKLHYDDPRVFTECEELGIPIFLLSAMKPLPDDPLLLGPQPTGYIATDHEFLGRSQARLLKQLRPEGGTFGSVLDWNSAGMQRRRTGFLQEITKDNDRDDRPSWYEVDYPYDTNVTGVFSPCHYMDCMMEGLANPANGVNPTGIIFFLQSPIRDPGYTAWVDRYRDQNITIIAMDAIDYLSFLSQGYVDGIVGQVVSEMGKMSAEVLAKVVTDGIGGPNGLQIPPVTRQFETSLISYNLIPTELDKKYPLQLDLNTLDNLSVIGIVLFAIVHLTVLICCAWTSYYRQNSVVRAAQPLFLAILLAGVFILSCTMIPLSLDDGGDRDSISSTFAIGICMSVPWLAFTGFAVVFAALFSKTWRVNKLFHTDTPFTRVQVSTQDVLGPFAVIFVSNVIVLTLWTILDPLTYVRQFGDGTDIWNREIESYGSCQSDKGAAPFLVPLAFINFSVLAIASWQAFEARNITSEFAESKYIGLAVWSLFQAFITAAPVLALVKDQPRAFYMVLVLAIFVLLEAILLLIFLPKMILARHYASMTEKQQRLAMAAQIKVNSLKSNEMGVGTGSTRGLEVAVETENAGTLTSNKADYDQPSALSRDVPFSKTGP